MKRVVLIAGVSSQQKEACEAKDLYTGKEFKTSWELTEYDAADAVYILSSQHILVEPNKVLSPYNGESWYDVPVAVRKEWAKKVLKALEDEGFDLSKDTFKIYARERYYQYLIGDGGIQNYDLVYKRMMEPSANDLIPSLEYLLKVYKRKHYGVVEVSDDIPSFYDVSKIKYLGDIIKILNEDSVLKIAVIDNYFNPEKTEEQMIDHLSDMEVDFRDTIRLGGIDSSRVTYPHLGNTYMTEENKKRFPFIYGNDCGFTKYHIH